MLDINKRKKKNYKLAIIKVKKTQHHLLYEHIKYVKMNMKININIK